MKKRMVPGILLSVLAVYMVFETVRLYSLITRPDGTFITDADVAFGLYLFGGLLELNPSLTYPNAPPYLFALCAVTVLLALAAVLCFWRARRGKAHGDRTACHERSIFMTRDELKAAAVAMLDRAYIPYSHFPVGAALECADGTVFTGCNIENAAFSPTICAERTAVAKAVSEGHRDFVRIAVAGRCDDFCVPCAVCRQVLREFAPNIEIICLNGAGQERTFTLPELLPHSFGPEYLTPEN